MNKIFRLTAIVLVAYLALGPMGSTVALAQQQSATQSAVTPAELDAALAARVADENAARERVAEVLEHHEVQAIAESLGLDLRDAATAVATLEGDALQQAATHATAIDAALAGGTVIQISLVAALLIVIIVILLVD